MSNQVGNSIGFLTRVNRLVLILFFYLFIHSFVQNAPRNISMTKLPRNISMTKVIHFLSYLILPSQRKIIAAVIRFFKLAVVYLFMNT